MTAATLDAAAAGTPAGGFAAIAANSYEAIAPRWRVLLAEAAATPFQSDAWLGAWYASMADGRRVEPVLVEVRDGSGALAFALPLVRISGAGPVRIEFADRGITDYNAPILGPAAPRDADAAALAWNAVRKALPRADLLVFTKLIDDLRGRRNPLLDALPVQVSKLHGNVVRIDGSFDDWLKSLAKHDRKEFGRFLRVFLREPGTRFERITNRADAARVLLWLENEQRERARLRGGDYVLDEEDYTSFYRSRLDGVLDGTTVVTALMAGDEVVAALYGVTDGDQYAMVRIAFADGPWANCSPGRLIIERSMHLLHGEGYRHFDFTTGAYAYKKTFGVAHRTLYDVTLALSPRGWPTVAKERAKTYVRAHPELEARVRRLLKRPSGETTAS